MLWLIIIAAVAVLYFLWRKQVGSEVADAKQEEVVAKVEAVLAPVVTEVKTVLDVNKDGAVTAADAVEAVKKVKAKATAKKAAPKAKAAAKKTKTPKLKVAK